MTLNINWPARMTVALVLSLALLVVGCARYTPDRPDVTPPVLTLADASHLPQFADHMDYDGIETAINQSLTYLSRVPEDRRFRFGPTEYDKPHMTRSLAQFRAFVATRPNREELNQFIRQHYLVYRSIGRPPDDNVLFTGYFEPLYPGSLTPSPDNPNPV